MSLKSQPYAENGVMLSKESLSVGDEVTITYEGLLAKSGADQIFMHIGYGDNWLERDFLPMENENGIFKGTVKLTHPEVLNFSFKDSADNWDNNSTQNYSFMISEKSKATKQSSTKSTSKLTAEVINEIDDVKENKKPVKASAEKKSSVKVKAKSTETNESKATAKKAAKTDDGAVKEASTKASTKTTAKAAKPTKATKA
ncbi:MAG: carbohydrate-binding protein [Bacillota bacterium]|nr:carbohydrate-binding protein [Bacillota bacterium]